jgi:hypothetical protein
MKLHVSSVFPPSLLGIPAFQPASFGAMTLRIDAMAPTMQRCQAGQLLLPELPPLFTGRPTGHSPVLPHFWPDCWLTCLLSCLPTTSLEACGVL